MYIPVYKYTYIHVYIKKICYLYILNIFIYNINYMNINVCKYMSIFHIILYVCVFISIIKIHSTQTYIM